MSPSPNLENGHAPDCPMDRSPTTDVCTCGWEALERAASDRQDKSDQNEQGERRAAAEAERIPVALERIADALEELCSSQGIIRAQLDGMAADVEALAARRQKERE